MIKKEPKLSYKYFRFAIIPVIFTGFYLLAFLIDPTRVWSDFFKRPSEEIILELFYVVFFCIVISEICLFLARVLDKKIPWYEFPIGRFSIQFSIQIAATLIFAFFYVYIAIYLFSANFKISDIKPLALRQLFVINVLLSVMVSLIHTGNYFLQQWKSAKEESSKLLLKSAELRQTALEAELHSLKMQLDPHFMFNNFSTLSALISEDEKLAQHFLENLSWVYRYMILNVKKDLISVKEELDFAKAYFYLMKIRLGNHIVMENNLSAETLKKAMPPLTLQLLIENAIKHNIASADKPLFIDINEDDAGNLMVLNSLQKLNFKMPSTNTGHKNIQERYKLLTDKVPEIMECRELFIVKLPLMELTRT
ncbi:histidine kinase [Pedobacter sp. MC2016-05]|uniref:sensor histidine kinase n=1 Tax=Pedobacter sp. MC2016-05 TaxID=2994474 RepID=UPI002247EF66|nr:histidine kinase [Pedobacter sp. MC2016-05]MCX2475343.1 histidine kinase [Pedobacter sp. MC2016-05]